MVYYFGYLQQLLPRLKTIRLQKVSWRNISVARAGFSAKAFPDLERERSLKGHFRVRDSKRITNKEMKYTVLHAWEFQSGIRLISVFKNIGEPEVVASAQIKPRC